jgi:hypothetical protein
MRVDFGTTDIPTAGERAQISTLVEQVLWIRFAMRDANTNEVYVGISDVSATNGWELSTNKRELELNFQQLGGSVTFNRFYVDSDASGNDVDWVVVLK